MKSLPPAAFLDARVIWDDQTPYGVALSGRLAQTIRETLHPRATALLSAELERPPDERRLVPINEVVDVVRAERRLLRYRRATQDNAFWRPDPALCAPHAIIVTGDEESEELTHIADGGGIAMVRTMLRGGDVPQPFSTLLKHIAERIASLPSEPVFCNPGQPTLIGHACVSLSDGQTRLWIDPFFRPKSRRYTPNRQPILPLDAPEGRHIVLITHCHPDHFDPGSLLRFPTETTLIVPPIRLETLLTLDIAFRARQLGFGDVRTLDWNKTTHIDGFEIRAFPFYGEQPLGCGAAGQSDRNVGSFYHVAEPNGLTALFLADAGSDPERSAAEWSRAIRRSVGEPDLLFANHRTWRLYPPHYLMTSVPHFLPCVPDVELDRVQQIMLTPTGLATVAGVLGAKRVIPYAMGGAPWFAELGLGFEHASGTPPLVFDSVPADVSRHEASDLIEPSFRACLMEPGDALDAQLECVRAQTPLGNGSAQTVKHQHLAVAYGGVAQADLGILLDAISKTTSAILIASPSFTEIIFAEAAEEEAMSFFAPFEAAMSCRWRLATRRPLTFAAFGTRAAWSAYFLGLHRNAINTLRERGDLVAALKATLAQSPTAPAHVIAAVANGLLGITPRITVRAELAAPHELASDIPSLSPEHCELVRDHGALSVTLALAQIKAAHNVFVTGRTCGHLKDRDEQAWLESVFGV